MKTGNAFVTFIDWNTSELFRAEHLGANTIALFLRHADGLVRSESQRTRPDVVDSAVELHRLAWFTDRHDDILLTSIFRFFVSLIAATQSFNDKNKQDGMPAMQFSAGLSEGRLSVDEKTKLFIGDAVNAANFCADRARDSGHLLVLNPSVFKTGKWASVLQRELQVKVETDLIPLNQQGLVALTNCKS